MYQFLIHCLLNHFFPLQKLMFIFFIYSDKLWYSIKGIYLLSPSFLINATEIFVVIGNTTFENQASIVYGLEKFTLESLSVNKRDMKIEVRIKIPIIKVREINFKLPFFSIWSSIYGKYFLSASAYISTFSGNCSMEGMGQVSGFPRGER